MRRCGLTLIEEAYEVLDAMKSGDDAKNSPMRWATCCCKLYFIRQIATEEGRFTVADVIREVHEKMVRRHPHVFGEKRAKDAAEVLRNWEQIKAEERAAQGGRSTARLKRRNNESRCWTAVPRGLAATNGRFAIDAEGFAGWI